MFAKPGSRHKFVVEEGDVALLGVHVYGDKQQEAQLKKIASMGGAQIIDAIFVGSHDSYNECVNGCSEAATR